MKQYWNFLLLNIIAFLIVIALVIYAKFFGSSVSALFMPPVAPSHPDERLLTHTFQILCTIPMMVCGFTWGLLRVLQPENKQNKFIFYSALVTGGFLINEIFRVHIMVAQMGFPKITVIFVYAIVAIAYGLSFKHIIKSTPYFLLLIGISLLAFGIIVDSQNKYFYGNFSLLEGIPKLFFQINVSLYFWYVCHREVLRVFKFSRS
jgi:hypothetical protein